MHMCCTLGRRCDLHGLHGPRNWNMRRSVCSAANDRISDDDFNGNSAGARHDLTSCSETRQVVNAST
jgi:hypothetical protein